MSDVDTLKAELAELEGKPAPAAAAKKPASSEGYPDLKAILDSILQESKTSVQPPAPALKGCATCRNNKFAAWVRFCPICENRDITRVVPDPEPVPEPEPDQPNDALAKSQPCTKLKDGYWAYLSWKEERETQGLDASVGEFLRTRSVA